MKFAFWRGAVQGEGFGEAWCKVFDKVLGFVLPGHSDQKNSAKTHGSVQQNLKFGWRKLWEKLHDEVLQGHACQENPHFFRREKSQNENSPNFSNFRPEFCHEFWPEFSPNFSRSFRASFRGKRRPEKIHQQKSPPFCNAIIPGKFEENRFTKLFWRGGKVTLLTFSHFLPYIR